MTSASLANSKSSYNPLQDPKLDEKAKTLALLTHAANCKSRLGQCTTNQHCKAAKVMLQHILKCTAQDNCRQAYCSMAKFVLKHGPQIKQAAEQKQQQKQLLKQQKQQQQQQQQGRKRDHHHMTTTATLVEPLPFISVCSNLHQSLLARPLSRRKRAKIKRKSMPIVKESKYEDLSDETSGSEYSSSSSGDDETTLASFSHHKHRDSIDDDDDDDDDNSSTHSSSSNEDNTSSSSSSSSSDSGSGDEEVNDDNAHVFSESTFFRHIQKQRKRRGSASLPSPTTTPEGKVMVMILPTTTNTTTTKLPLLPVLPITTRTPPSTKTQTEDSKITSPWQPQTNITVPMSQNTQQVKIQQKPPQKPHRRQSDNTSDDDSSSSDTSNSSDKDNDKDKGKGKALPPQMPLRRKSDNHSSSSSSSSSDNDDNNDDGGSSTSGSHDGGEQHHRNHSLVDNTIAKNNKETAATRPSSTILKTTSPLILLMDVKCQVCGLEQDFVEDGIMKQCPHCLQANYCSTECLEWDWNSGDHKETCSRDKKSEVQQQQQPLENVAFRTTKSNNNETDDTAKKRSPSKSNVDAEESDSHSTTSSSPGSFSSSASSSSSSSNDSDAISDDDDHHHRNESKTKTVDLPNTSGSSVHGKDDVPRKFEIAQVTQPVKVPTTTADTTATAITTSGKYSSAPTKTKTSSASNKLQQVGWYSMSIGPKVTARKNNSQPTPAASIDKNTDNFWRAPDISAFLAKEILTPESVDANKAPVSDNGKYLVEWRALDATNPGGKNDKTELVASSTGTSKTTSLASVSGAALPPKINFMNDSGADLDLNKSILNDPIFTRKVGWRTFEAHSVDLSKQKGRASKNQTTAENAKKASPRMQPKPTDLSSQRISTDSWSSPAVSISNISPAKPSAENCMFDSDSSRYDTADSSDESSDSDLQQKNKLKTATKATSWSSSTPNATNSKSTVSVADTEKVTANVSNSSSTNSGTDQHLTKGEPHGAGKKILAGVANASVAAKDAPKSIAPGNGSVGTASQSILKPVAVNLSEDSGGSKNVAKKSNSAKKAFRFSWDDSSSSDEGSSDSEEDDPTVDKKTGKMSKPGATINSLGDKDVLSQPLSAGHEARGETFSAPVAAGVAKEREENQGPSMDDMLAQWKANQASGALLTGKGLIKETKSTPSTTDASKGATKSFGTKPTVDKIDAVSAPAAEVAVEKEKEEDQAQSVDDILAQWKASQASGALLTGKGLVKETKSAPIATGASRGAKSTKTFGGKRSESTPSERMGQSKISQSSVSAYQQRQQSPSQSNAWASKSKDANFPPANDVHGCDALNPVAPQEYKKTTGANWADANSKGANETSASVNPVQGNRKAVFSMWKERDKPKDLPATDKTNKAVTQSAFAMWRGKDTLNQGKGEGTMPRVSQMAGKQSAFAVWKGKDKQQGIPDTAAVSSTNAEKINGLDIPISTTQKRNASMGKLEKEEEPFPQNESGSETAGCLIDFHPIQGDKCAGLESGLTERNHILNADHSRPEKSDTPKADESTGHVQVAENERAGQKSRASLLSKPPAAELVAGQVSRIPPKLVSSKPVEKSSDVRKLESQLLAQNISHAPKPSSTVEKQRFHIELGQFVLAKDQVDSKQSSAMHAPKELLPPRGEKDREKAQVTASAARPTNASTPDGKTLHQELATAILRRGENLKKEREPVQSVLKPLQKLPQKPKYVESRTSVIKGSLLSPETTSLSNELASALSVRRSKVSERQNVEPVASQRSQVTATISQHKGPQTEKNDIDGTKRTSSPVQSHAQQILGNELAVAVVKRKVAVLKKNKGDQIAPFQSSLFATTVPDENGVKGAENGEDTSPTRSQLPTGKSGPEAPQHFASLGSTAAGSGASTITAHGQRPQHEAWPSWKSKELPGKEAGAPEGNAIPTRPESVVASSRGPFVEKWRTSKKKAGSAVPNISTSNDRGQNTAEKRYVPSAAQQGSAKISIFSMWQDKEQKQDPSFAAHSRINNKKSGSHVGGEETKLEQKPIWSVFSSPKEGDVIQKPFRLEDKEKVPREHRIESLPTPTETEMSHDSGGDNWWNSGNNDIEDLDAWWDALDVDIDIDALLGEDDDSVGAATTEVVGPTKTKAKHSAENTNNQQEENVEDPVPDSTNQGGDWWNVSDGDDWWSGGGTDALEKIVMEALGL